MIVLDIAAVILVGIGVAIYLEIKVLATNARAHYKIEGLHRFK